MRGGHSRIPQRFARWRFPPVECYAADRLPALLADGRVIGTVGPILPDSGLRPPALPTSDETVSFVFARRVVIRWANRRACAVVFDDIDHAETWPDFELQRAASDA